MLSYLYMNFGYLNSMTGNSYFSHHCGEIWEISFYAYRIHSFFFLFWFCFSAFFFFIFFCISVGVQMSVMTFAITSVVHLTIVCSCIVIVFFIRVSFGKSKRWSFEINAIFHTAFKNTSMRVYIHCSWSCANFILFGVYFFCPSFVSFPVFISFPLSFVSIYDVVIFPFVVCFI